MIPLSDRERVEAERLLNNALGAEIQALAAQAGVEDIAINPDGRAFVYTGTGKRRLETRFDADRRSQIVTLAARFAGVVAEGKGRLSFAADLPGQIRFQGGIPPRSVGGPYVVLRFLPKPFEPSMTMFLTVLRRSRGARSTLPRRITKRSVSVCRPWTVLLRRWPAS